MTRSIKWKDLWPESANSLDWAHAGVAVTDAGDVIFAEPAGGGLVLLHAGGDAIERRPLPPLEIHGISYSRDDTGEYLWLADPGIKARPNLAYEIESRPGHAVGSLCRVMNLRISHNQRSSRTAQHHGVRPPSLLLQVPIYSRSSPMATVQVSCTSMSTEHLSDLLMGAKLAFVSRALTAYSSTTGRKRRNS